MWWDKIFSVILVLSIFLFVIILLVVEMDVGDGESLEVDFLDFFLFG